MVTARINHTIVTYKYQDAKYENRKLWNIYHIFLNASQRYSIILDLFQEYPFIIHKLSKLSLITTNRRQLYHKREKQCRLIIYAQLKQLKSKERKAKRKMDKSLIFNSFAYLIFHSKGINLEFTRERILSYGI
tara:strand:+ start:109 stop:507 length:399 start_codon:yes stop_codon:yes gene_type:complete